jgi:hypothetical protein
LKARTAPAVPTARAAPPATVGACALAGATWISYSPDASLTYATLRPSGDHAGDRSCAPGVLVSTRGSPFSAGTLTISPRTSTASRAPLGLGDRLRTYSAPFTHRGRVSRRSAGTPTARRRVAPVAGSYSHSHPACSYTRRPPPPDAFSTGKSRCRVSCVSARVRVSYRHRLNSPSRSERRYTASPIQATGTSLARPAGCGTFSTCWVATS